MLSSCGIQMRRPGMAPAVAAPPSARWLGRAALAVALTVAATLSAPGAVAQERAGTECAPERRIGDLGISSFECNCTYSRRSSGERTWRFRSEPEILRVREDGPGAGVLRPGDVITAIDDRLITTREGGRRFANVEPGDEVKLTLRRDDRIVQAWVTAGARCEARPPAAPETPAPPGATREPRPVEPAPLPELTPLEVKPLPAIEAAPFPELAPLPAPAPSVFPSGWLGFGIICNCDVRIGESSLSGEELRVEGAARGAPIWSFREPPEVYSVEPGSPADSAGLKAGDALLEIDGVPLVSEEGGRRFGAVRAGQTVRLKYRRGSTEGSVAITAGERYVGPERPVVPRAPRREALLYVGRVGDVDVEVRGGSSVMITVVEEGREIEIVTPGARIRVRRR